MRIFARHSQEEEYGCRDAFTVAICRDHFSFTSFFVPLTLGLSIIIAWMETRHVMSGDEFWKKAGAILG